MDHFERDSRRLIDALVKQLVGISREVMKAAFVAARRDVRSSRSVAKVRAKDAKRTRREAARAARRQAVAAKREARASERLERERLRAERKAERE
jgi:hypothetical protein